MAQAAPAAILVCATSIIRHLIENKKLCFYGNYKAKTQQVQDM